MAASVSVLEEEKLSLELELAQARELIQTHDDQIRELSPFKGEVLRLTKELQDYHRMHEIATSKIGELSVLVGARAEENIKLEMQNENIYEELAGAKMLIGLLEDGIFELVSSVELPVANSRLLGQELTGKLQASNAQREILEQQLMIMRSMFENLEKELLQSKTTISQLSTEVLDHKKEYKSASVKVEELTALVAVLEERKLELEQQIQIKDVELAQAKEKIQAYEDRISRLVFSLQSSESKIRRLEHKLKEPSEDDLEQLEHSHFAELIKPSLAAVEEFATMVTELEGMLEVANSQINERDQKLCMIERKYQEMLPLLGVLTSEKDELVEQNKIKEDELAGSKQLLASQEDRINELVISLESAMSKTQHLEQMLKDHSGKKLDYLSQAEDFAKVVELGAATEALNMQKEELKVQQALMTEKFNSSEEALLRSESIILQLNTELLDCRKNFESASANLCELRTSLESVAVEKRKLEEQNYNKDVELNKARQLIAMHEERINELLIYLESSMSRTRLLEQKLKESADKIFEHQEQSHAFSQRHLELEYLIKTSGAAAEAAALKVLDLEDALQVSNFQKEEVEQQLSMMRSKYEHSEAELLQYKNDMSRLNIELLNLADASARMQELTSSFDLLVEEKKKLEERYQKKEEEFAEAKKLIRTYEDRISQLLFSLDTSTSRTRQLEHELKESSDKIMGYQERSHTISKRHLEWEDLMKTSRAAAAESALKVIELEEALQALNAHNVEVEQEMHSIRNKLADSESELLQLRGRVPQIYADVQNYETKTAHLEGVCQNNEVKIRELTTSLGALLDEKKKLQEQVVDSKEKLQDQVIEKEAMQARLMADIASLRFENETLQNAMVDQEKLNQGLDKYDTAYSHLHEGTSKEVLEQHANSAIDLHYGVRTKGEALIERNTELEASITELVSTKENLLVQHSESQSKLMSAENKAIDLADQLSRAEFELFTSQREIEQLKKRVFELNNRLLEKANEVAESRHSLQEFEDKNKQLASSLHETLCRVSQLEENFDNLSDKYLDQKSYNHSIQQRVRGLDDLICDLRSKCEDAEAKVKKLEHMLETANSQVEELRQNVAIYDSELKESKAEAAKYRREMGQLYVDIEASQDRAASFESLLHDRARESAQLYTRIVAEKERLEEDLRSSERDLLSAVKLVEILQDELESARDKLDLMDIDIKASKARENDLLEKLKFAEEQLASKETEHQKAPYIRELHEEQEMHCKGLVFAESEEAASMRSKASANARNHDALEKSVEACKSKVSDAELKLMKVSADNKLLTDTNNTLREQLDFQLYKNNELGELLHLSSMDNQDAAKKISELERTISQMNEDLSVSSELRLAAADLRSGKAEGQLHEAMEKLDQICIERNKLSENVEALEIELGYYEEQITAADHKDNVEEAQRKIKELGEIVVQAESVIEKLQIENADLTRASQRLEIYQKKVYELEESLKAAIIEKDNVHAELLSLKKTMHEITQYNEELEAKVSRLMEESRIVHDHYQSTKKELKEVIIRLEEQVVEKSTNELHATKLERQFTMSEQRHMDEINNLQMKVAEKDEALHAKRMEYANALTEKNELEEQLLDLRKELDDAYLSMAQQDLKWDVELTHSLKELEVQRLCVADLEKNVKDLKERLQESEKLHNQRVLVEHEKLAHVNKELDDLRHKMSENVERENKILSFEQRLQAAVSGAEARDLGPSTPLGRVVEPENISNKNSRVVSIKTVQQAATLLSTHKLVLGAAVASLAATILFRKRLRSNLKTIVWLSQIFTS